MNINDVYREICDNPHDDEPRLRFAELIEPSDGEWARFIRRQIEATRRRRRGDIGTTDRRQPSRRWSTSLAPLAAYGRWEAIEFDRGFPALIPMHPEVFAEYGEQLFRLAPIRHVDFDHPYDEDHQLILDHDGKKAEFPLDRVLACPALGKLESIGFENLRFPRDWAKQMVACNHLTSCLYMTLHMTFHTQSDIIELLESQQIRKMIQIVSEMVSPPGRGNVDLGIGSERSNAQGGPEWTTYHYGALGKQLEEKYGYVPWLHQRPNIRHDLWWYVESGRYPEFPVGSLPPKEEWYTPPKPRFHPRTW